MRLLIRDFVSLVAASVPILEPIYEFGSLQVPGQEGVADLRPLFPKKKYVGCDMQEGAGVDKIVDLHNINLPSDSVGTVLCLDTLEHVECPYRALEQIHRILKRHGIAVISSVMYYPIHDHPHDYWRFTPEAFRSILKPFSDSFIGFPGDESFPHTVVGIGFKGEPPLLAEFRKRYKVWHNRHSKYMEHIIRLAAPPILLPFLSRLHKAILGTFKD